MTKAQELFFYNGVPVGSWWIHKKTYKGEKPFKIVKKERRKSMFYFDTEKLNEKGTGLMELESLCFSCKRYYPPSLKANTKKKP
jgi:hypothetical protein